MTHDDRVPIHADIHDDVDTRIDDDIDGANEPAGEADKNSPTYSVSLYSRKLILLHFKGDDRLLGDFAFYCV